MSSVEKQINQHFEQAFRCVAYLRHDLNFLQHVESIVATCNQQDAQLSQRDRAAGCVIVFAKSRRLELGDNILRTLYVYLQQLSYNRPENLSNSVKNAK